MSDVPTWRRLMDPSEHAVLATRYAQLQERWQQRWPDEPVPPLAGDALEQVRTVQAMAHRLRGEGIRPEGGIRRGPGLEVADADLRAEIERAKTAATPKESDGDSGS